MKIFVIIWRILQIQINCISLLLITLVPGIAEESPFIVVSYHPIESLNDEVIEWGVDAKIMDKLYKPIGKDGLVLENIDFTRLRNISKSAIIEVCEIVSCPSPTPFDKQSKFEPKATGWLFIKVEIESFDVGRLDWFEWIPKLSDMPIFTFHFFHQVDEAEVLVRILANGQLITKRNRPPTAAEKARFNLHNK
jgi:hypothetical protein